MVERLKAIGFLMCEQRQILVYCLVVVETVLRGGCLVLRSEDDTTHQRALTILQNDKPALEVWLCFSRHVESKRSRDARENVLVVVGVGWAAPLLQPELETTVIS